VASEMSHRQARRKLGSRSTRRSGVRVVKGKSGARRAGKVSVALLTWALVEGKPRPVNTEPMKAKTERKSWVKRNKGREAVQAAYLENLTKPSEIANDSEAIL